MTRIGANRDLYSRTIETRVSRFSPDYAAWAARADAHFEKLEQA